MAHPSSAPAPAPVPGHTFSGTLGHHLARRLVEIGVSDVFSVPGDFNLTLLDHLIDEPELNLIGCCNELNAGYAADGYARAKGVGACVVTFTVGGLSVLNAIAGAYSENLPIICIVGGPNSNDYGTNRILHHTTGLPDFTQELRCFQTVTCVQAVVTNLDDAHEQIDTAISTALKESKPAYISISCNLSGIPHPTFSREPVPFFLAPKVSNYLGLEAAVEATAEFLNKAVKPVIIGGPKLRVAKAQKAFIELADASGYPIAVMPSGKGLVPEHHPHFIGTYWGAVSTSFCAEIVESADAYVFVGPIFNDYSSVGYSLLIKKEKSIIVQPNRVTIGNGLSLGWVFMADFLSALAKKLKKNSTALENYRRIFVPPGMPLMREKDEPLRVNVLFKHIQNMLGGDSAVIAETGDSWFNCQKLCLPENCGYEFQMQYGSIGWSVGATLGYAQAARDKRVIACIGDGSFQVTAQDISTMIRCGQRTIIFLINNGGYTIEVEIHDGPYNVIKNWDYTGLVNAIHNGEGKCWTAKVRTEDELTAAIATVTGEQKDSLCFIEIFVHKDDTSKELLEWGSRVSAANSSPGEAKGFVEEMRFVAMKLHTREQAKEGEKEVKEKEEEAVRKWEPSIDGYLKFLVDSKLVYDTLEEIVEKASFPFYAEFRNTGLERSEKLAKDLEWFKEQGYNIPKPSSPGVTYSQILQELSEKDPQAFICHFYNIYFAHSAGGQMIGRKVAEQLLNKKELEFYKWDGDLSQLLQNVRDKLNKVAEGWTREEKDHCLEETEKSFKHSGEILRLILS